MAHQLDALNLLTSISLTGSANRVKASTAPKKRPPIPESAFVQPPTAPIEIQPSKRKVSTHGVGVGPTSPRNVAGSVDDTSRRLVSQSFNGVDIRPFDDLPSTMVGKPALHRADATPPLLSAPHQQVPTIKPTPFGQYATRGSDSEAQGSSGSEPGSPAVGPSSILKNHAAVAAALMNPISPSKAPRVPAPLALLSPRDKTEFITNYGFERHYRMVFRTAKHQSPFAVSSVIGYNANKKKKPIKLEVRKGGAGTVQGGGDARSYVPDFLDDPALTVGKHRVVLTLPGMRESIIPYVRKKELEEAINEQFHSQHPDLPAQLTLTMIRKLKKKMLETAQLVRLNFGTIALSHIYFERLILLRRVSKDNAKLKAATSLLLAGKFDHSTTAKAFVRQFIETICKNMSVSHKELLRDEVVVLAHLGFRLHQSQEQVMPHYIRLSEQVVTTQDVILRYDSLATVDEDGPADLLVFTTPMNNT